MLTAHTGNRVNSIKLAAILLISLSCSGLYLALVNNDLRTLAGFVALLGQVGMDIIISLLTFKLYKATNLHHLKFIYLMFFLSAIAAMVSDGIYHTAMNILDMDYFNKANSLFEIPFLFFLLFQVIAWLRIFFTDYETKNRKKYHFLPYITVAVFIFFTFVCIIPWKIHYLSRLGIYQLTDTLLEVIGFALSAVCLARSKSNPIRFLSIGYLFVISSDLLIRYDVISGAIPFLSTFESTWIIGLLLMATGFFYIQSSTIKLLPLSSLQSYIAIWLLNILSLFVLLFLMVNYFFPYKEVSNYLLLVVIPCTPIAILFSKYFASKILSPLERLESIVKEFLTGEISKYSDKIKYAPTAIDDFILLEKFVYDALELYKKNHSIELEYAKMATQVAHDIKSPMIALNNYFKDAIQLDKNKYEVVESSLCRINEIANNLLAQYKKSEVTPQADNNDIDLIAVFLQTLIEEKKLQFQNSTVEINIVIDQSAETAYTLFNAERFKRSISNLMNNAVESIAEKGLVAVSLQRKIDVLVLEIKDNGCGISDEILKQIQQGKKIQHADGNGLGLSYTLKSIKEWGATYEIDTKKEQGTTFRIIFPLQETPDWAQEEIYVYDDLNVVIIDDDYSIFKLWEKKIVNAGNPTIKLTYLSCPAEVNEYIIDAPNINNKLFLIDYHFNQSNSTGIELIKSLRLNNAILVTNRYPDSTIKVCLKEAGIKYVLKKNMLLTKIFNVHKTPDLILVDDKKLITETWMIESKKHGKKIVTFNSKNILMKYIDLIDRVTPIYLDLNLDKDNGDVIAKNLYDLGYKKLYITTGYDLKRINKSPWIIGVISKEPPFSKNLIRV